MGRKRNLKITMVCRVIARLFQDAGKMGCSNMTLNKMGSRSIAHDTFLSSLCTPGNRNLSRGGQGLRVLLWLFTRTRKVFVRSHSWRRATRIDPFHPSCARSRLIMASFTRFESPGRQGHRETDRCSPDQHLILDKFYALIHDTFGL